MDSFENDLFNNQLNGGNNKKKIGILMQKSIVISLITMFGNAALLLSSKQILKFIAEDQQVAYVADQYILVFLPTILFYNLAAILSKYIQSQNIVYPIMYMNFVAIILNAALHAIFIYGFKMGVKGAALAVDFSSFFLVLFLIGYIYYKKIYVDSWNGWSIECLYEWKLYLKLAIPGLFSILIEWSNFEIGSFAASSLPKIELAIMAIAQQVLFIFFQIPFGISIAANIRIGNFLGSNQPDLAKNSMKITYFVTSLAVLIISVIMLSFSSILPYAFSSEPDVVEKASSLLKFVSLIHILDGFQGTNSGILRACGFQLYSSIFLLIGFYFIGSPIGLSLMLTTELKIFGFFSGIFVGCSVLIILQFFFIFRVDWTELARKAGELANDDSNDSQFSSSNPNYEISNDIESINKTDLDKNNITSFQFDQTTTEELTRSSIREQILKRLFIFIIFLIFFIVAIILHEIL
ncbi:unnamed protein product [Brachionus calyciflorus]|uniref:Multidrug and toxin extrusion protein n=1 Tax=Brachionus calyciflorus TaxID=104777 RepID=A0A814H9X8_9BILA|nr:unnamed protein product [Brachionus calyciflorus]